jgi:triacylglycerol lipase
MGPTMSFFTILPKELYSRDAFANFKGGADFDSGNALALAWMSQLSYETATPPTITEILGLWGLRLVDNGVVVKAVTTGLPIASTCGFVAKGFDATFVVFAGTDPLVVANLITDFDIHPATTGAAQGYDVAAAAVWPDVKALVEKAAGPGGKVFLAGHSLGAALAALIAHRISTDSVADVEAVYTIGMPRPGRHAFAAAYDAQRLGMRTYRLVHGQDLVPTVAPAFLDFRHVGRFLHCQRGGKFDPAQLTPDTSSDDPGFVAGVSQELSGLWHGPEATIRTQVERLKLAADMALGRVPPGTRTDAGGIAIELLPPRLRDHMPDRYIGALSK